MAKKTYANDPKQQPLVDEWGDPIKLPAEKGPKQTVVDEWGDPVRYVRVNPAEKYVSEKEKLALERELVSKGLIFPRSHYLPRGRFRGVLAVCLAFLFGLFICLGALVGVGAWVGTRAKIRQLLGANTEKWINPEYADMSVLDFVSTVVGDMKGGLHTLGDIAKYTPAVDSLLNTLGENTAALGIELTEDLRTKLKDTPFNGLGAFIMDDVLKTVELGKVMKVTPSSDGMMIGLCYGEEDEDYTLDGETFVPVEGGRTPTTIGMLMDSPQDVISTMRLGTLMGLNRGVTDQSLKDNAMMYALCYGKRGTDYEVSEEGKIVILNKKTETGTAEKTAGETPAEPEAGDTQPITFPTTVSDLMERSNAVINSLELGDMLGLDGTDVDSNGVMYSLAYGSRGTDWELKDGKIVMLEGHDPQYPTKMKSFTEGSSDLIQGMEVETLMSIKPGSDKLMHYLAYGSEMQKGTAPYLTSPEHPGVYRDAEGKRVNKYGYLLNEEGTGYLTETVKVTEKNEAGESAESEKLQYAGGGRYVYTYDEVPSETDGEPATYTVTGIEMLPDPNDPEGKPYSKKKVGDLSKEEADVLEGMKMGDVMEIDSSSSRIMQAMKNWTIGDLKDQGKIDSLKMSDVLEIHEEDAEDGSYQKSSGIILAMKNWTLKDLNNQHRIERLKIGNVITIDEKSAGIMQAMKDWSIGELTDQSKINALTLGDVMDITETSGILASLKDCPIGSMQARVDTLTLSEILGDSIGENKILKPLAGSTVKTLASDMEALPIGTVFADEMFSYMKVEEGGKTYQELYNDYFKNHAVDSYNLKPNTESEGLSTTTYKASENPHLPQAYKPDGTTKLKASDSNLLTYYVLKDTKTEAERHYYLSKDGGERVPEGKEVKTDAQIVMDNRDTKTEGYTPKTPYYFETEIVLTPVYAYAVYNYETGAAGEPIQTVEHDSKVFYKPAESEAEYEIKDDGYSFYYEMPNEAGELVRYDLDRAVVRYEGKDNGKTYNFVTNKGVLDKNQVTDGTEGSAYELRHKKAVAGGEDVEPMDAYDYIIERTEAYLLYVTKDSSVGSYHEESEVEERYRYQKSEGEYDEVERYVDGVWYLLLANVEGETEEAAGTITFNADTPILKMDEQITKINSSLTDTTLWKLYFHGLLDENPYYSFSGLTWLKEGAVTFTPSKGEKGKTRKVYNLNDVEISEVVALVKGLIETVNNEMKLLGSH